MDALYTTFVEFGAKNIKILLMNKNYLEVNANFEFAKFRV